MFYGISIESFIAGFVYGGTTVLVGQPMETIKTLTQVSTTSRPNMITTAKELYSSSGIRGFYRGGTPLLIGGGLMRSAQFGFYNSVLPFMDTKFGKRDPQTQYWLGCVNPHVVAAGWAGGIGRGLVEGPFEMVKVRRQVVSDWKLSDITKGFGVTLFRNSFLFSSFVIYMDVLRQQLAQRDMTLSPFFTAGICSNMAWLTIWPFDVVKTKRQSGKYEGRSIGWLLKDTIRTGDMYRGLSAGMLRSFFANGISMEVYTRVEKELKIAFNER
jgi:solute carrier family 25 (mitochondrial carnitine/acylcarnitine transporter), member 20/29